MTLGKDLSFFDGTQEHGGGGVFIDRGGEANEERDTCVSIEVTTGSTLSFHTVVFTCGAEDVRATSGRTFAASFSQKPKYTVRSNGRAAGGPGTLKKGKGV